MDPKKAQEKVEKILGELSQVEKDMGRTINARVGLKSQLSENENVKKELDLMDEEDDIYKLIGPVLIKQDLVEAKSNVAKRIEFISAELKRTDAAIKKLEESQETKRMELVEFQQKIQSFMGQSAQKV